MQEHLLDGNNDVNFDPPDDQKVKQITSIRQAYSHHTSYRVLVKTLNCCPNSNIIYKDINEEKTLNCYPNSNIIHENINEGMEENPIQHHLHGRNEDIRMTSPKHAT